MSKPPKERWWVGVLVFDSHIEGPDSSPEVNVEYRLIRAADAETAYQRAVALGRRDEISYEIDDGRTCTLTFKGLQDLQEVLEDELCHGAEVFGFIEDGRAEDRVVSRDRLSAFLDVSDN